MITENGGMIFFEIFYKVASNRLLKNEVILTVYSS